MLLTWMRLIDQVLLSDGQVELVLVEELFYLGYQSVSARVFSMQSE